MLEPIGSRLQIPSELLLLGSQALGHCPSQRGSFSQFALKYCMHYRVMEAATGGAQRLIAAHISLGDDTGCDLLSSDYFSAAVTGQLVCTPNHR